ncbi:MAG: hypothetical protein IIB31_07775 [Chloroflexi bacterium]|nr:hypothetical protein [Chloroflexota bacterium]
MTWLNTLDSLGYVSSSALVIPILLLLALTVWIVWRSPLPFDRKFR